MSDQLEAKGLKPTIDPGALNAAMFKAYKGECDCETCRILRGMIETAIDPYLNPRGVKKSGRG